MSKSACVLAVFLASCTGGSAPSSFGVLSDSGKAALTRWCGTEQTSTDGANDAEILRCGAIDTGKEAIVRVDKRSRRILGFFARAPQTDVQHLAGDVLGAGLTAKEQDGLMGLYGFMNSGKHPRGDTKKWNGDASELSLQLMAHASDVALDLELRPYANEHLSSQAKGSVTAYVSKWCDAHQGTVASVPVPADDTVDRAQCQDAKGGELAQFTVDKHNDGVLDFEINPLTLSDFDAFLANAFTQLPHVEPSADDLRAFLQGGGPDERNWPHGSSARRFPAHEAIWELTAEHR